MERKDNKHIIAYGTIERKDNKHIIYFTINRVYII